jgi:serine/threonine-protein kinase HipA
MDRDILDIYVGDRLTATLERDPQNLEYVFSYLPGATDPISLTMPVIDTEDRFVTLPPVLETSLPEGELLEAIFRKMGKAIKLNDDFDLLKLVGMNLIGRLTIVPSGESPSARFPFTQPDRLEALLRSPNSKDMVTRAMIDFAERTGISGVLPKTFAISDGKSRLALPAGDYILKTESDESPGICIVEHACMIACRSAGLDVPETILSDDGKSLLVRRFDIGPDGMRYGFEDFCSLRFISRKGKYEGSYEGAAKLLSLFSTDPEADRRKFFRAFAMMHLLKNGDAHLKNFGILYTSPEDVRLSPTYDMVTTTAFLPKDAPALTLKGNRTWLDAEGIAAFGAENCGLGTKETMEILEECLSGIEETIPLLRDLSERHPMAPVQRALSTFRQSPEVARESIIASMDESPAPRKSSRPTPE